jgi:hypothetical protein
MRSGGWRGQRCADGRDPWGGDHARPNATVRTDLVRRVCQTAYLARLLVIGASAAPTWHGLHDLDLFAGTGVLDKVPDVDDAIVAVVGAIMILSR